MSKLFTLPKEVILTNTGALIPGAKAYFYEAGTATPLSVYTEYTLGTPHANPVVADGNGRFPTIYLDPTDDYKVTIKTAADVEIYSQDYVASPTPPSQAEVGGALYPRTAAEISASVTPTLYHYEVGDVKRYGAVGDGVTNDTTAFADASNVIEAQGGGTLTVPPGTYIVGSQNFAGSTGQGYSYQANPIIFIDSCTKPVVIEGNGAILKIADGLKFGAFDPTTGLSYASTPPFSDADYAASVGNLIGVFNSASVTIRDFELDGNLQNINLGGQWGDTGYQLNAGGVRVVGNSQVIIENVYAHHHGQDGVYVGDNAATETSEAKPVTLINVRSEYNARQGLSWVGGIGLTATNCKFNHTGKSTFSSAPRAGVDVEPDGSSVCRNGTFINSEFLNNSGVGFLADTGDSADISLRQCKFVGTTNYPIWPQKPRISFTDCLIVGTYVNSYASTSVPEDATRYTRCLFSDEAKYGATIYLSGALLSLSNVQSNVTYTDCTWNATTSKVGRLDGSNLIRCIFNLSAGTGYIADSDWALIAWGATLENCEINDNITVNPPTNAYYIALNSGWDTQWFYGVNTLNSANSKVRWYSVASGYTGILYNTEHRFSTLRLGGGFNDKESLLTVETAAPTTGTWKQGDIIFNGLPAAAGTVGWVCVTDGTFSSATDATGDTDGSTAVITGMTDTSDFAVGDYVTVTAGFSSSSFPYTVLALTSTTMTLNANSTSSQTNVTVATVDPVFKTFGTIAA